MSAVIANFVTSEIGDRVLIGPLGAPQTTTDAASKVYVDNSVAGVLKYRGLFAPSGGVYPTCRVAGYYWVASDNGVVDTIQYYTGDWAVYNGNAFDRVVSEAAAEYVATWAGSTNLTTLGTITTGVWHGTKIDETHGGAGAVSGILKQAAGTVSAAQADVDYITPSYVANWAGSTNLTTLGTITSGVWHGTKIDETHGGAGAVSGILKQITGTISAAQADVDYITPSYIANWAGSTNVITLGTVTTGVWHGTKIDETHGGAGAVSGILKQAAGTVSAAQADVDYATPSYVSTQIGAIPDASAIIKGLVNTTTQTFAGTKTIKGDVVVANATDPSKFGTLSADGSANLSLTAPIVKLGTPLWSDLQMISSIRGGGTAPSFSSFITMSGSYPIYLYSFSNGDIVYFQGQMPHNWVQNSLIYPHIHVATTSNMSANTVTWRMVYSVVNKITDVITTTPTDNQTSQVTGLTAYTPTMVMFPSSGAGKTITGITGSSALIIGMLTRDSGSYGSGMFLIALDFHIQMDNVNGDPLF